MGCRTARLASPVLGEESPLERTHRSFFGRIRVIPAAEVQSAMSHEQPELVGRRPSDVSGLTATPSVRLLDRALDGHHDVADRLPNARRQRESPRGGTPTCGLAFVMRKDLRREDRERENVGRAGHVHVMFVELGQLRVTRERQPDSTGG
jgi:hypothetical protein